MPFKPRVPKEIADEAIGEIAYKHPTATLPEIYKLCRERCNVAVSYTQVVRAMRELRRLQKEAFAEPPAGGPDYDTRGQEG